MILHLLPELGTILLLPGVILILPPEPGTILVLLPGVILDLLPEPGTILVLLPGVILDLLPEPRTILILLPGTLLVCLPGMVLVQHLLYLVKAETLGPLTL